MKAELPKLIGFSDAEVFLLDRPNKNLYCMSVRPGESQQEEEGIMKRAIEEDFTIQEK